MRMLRRTEFYPWPNGPCYRALCSLGLGGFPPAGARADQAGGASQVSARSEHARSLRRPGTRHAELRYRGPWSPGTGILVSDNFQSCRVERKEPHDLEAPSWARTGSTHHPCGGGLRRLRMFPAHERRVMEASSDVAVLLTGVTPPRRSRVRAAAAVAAANSGPIGTHGLQSGVKSGEEMHRSTQAQKLSPGLDNSTGNSTVTRQ